MQSIFIKNSCFLITVLALFAACNGQRQVPVKQENTDILVEMPANHRKYKMDTYDSADFKLAEISSIYFDTTVSQSGEVVVQDSSGEKQNGVLRLPLITGVVVAKTDTGVSDGSSDSYVEYEYKGLFKSIEQYYILALSYESYAFFLIDRRTGEETSIGIDPVVSPHATKIISWNIDESEITENLPIGLSIMEILNKKVIGNKERNITLYCQKEEGYSYYPDSKELYWENENVLLLKFSYKGIDTGEHSDYLRLEMKNNIK
jgi:hypothetical protein